MPKEAKFGNLRDAGRIGEEMMAREEVFYRYNQVLRKICREKHLVSNDLRP